MRFDVSINKLSKVIVHMCQAGSYAEKCYNKLNAVCESGAFQGGLYSGVLSSLKHLCGKLSTEKNECASLGNILSNISNIYRNMDNSLVNISEVRRYLGEGTIHKENTDLEESHFGGLGRSRFPNAPEFRDDYPEFTEGYIIVDDMNYLPIPRELYERVFIGKLYVDGSRDEPLAKLHDSAKPENGEIDWDLWSFGAVTKTGAIVAESLDLTAGELLHHFYTGNGDDYHYDASQLLANESVSSNFNNNITEFAMACNGNIENGQTIIVANSRDNALIGCPGFLGADSKLQEFADILFNANTFATINKSDAGVVAEVSRIGNQYFMKYNYYLVDYYDYDKTTLRKMYDMNVNGYGTNFMGYGKISGYATWSEGSDTVINVPAVTIGTPIVPGLSPTEYMPDLSPIEASSYVPGF